MTWAQFRKGRVLSGKNHAAVAKAAGAIAGVLAAAGKLDDDGKIGDGQPGPGADGSVGANAPDPASAADGTGTRSLFVPEQAPVLRYLARRR